MVGRGVMIPPFSLVGVWRIPSSTPSRCRHRLQCSCNCAATGASSSRQSSAIPRLHTASPHSRPVEVQIVLRSQVMSTKKPAAKRAGKTAKEQVPAVLPKKALVNGPQKQVFILDDATELDNLSTLQCISLVHPRHNKPTRFLHSATSIWEVQRIYQPPSSWIIQHGVQEDGSFYMCTRIDPLFLALPLLEKGRKKTAESEGSFMQLDQLLSKSEFPTALLGPNGAIGAASAYTLCDKRDGWNEPVVRLSDDKVLAWLRAKVERMRHEFKKVPSLAHHYSPAEREETPEQEKERLGQQRREREEAEAKSKADSEDAMEEKKEGDSADAAASSSAAAISPSPATSSTSSTDRAPASSSLKMSLQFLSSYVTPGTFLRLLASYSLAYDDVFEKKRAAAAARAWESTGSGKISGDVDIARGSSSSAAANSDDKKRKAEKISVTAKKLATAAKGTKSLASFFGAAPKKAPTA